MNYELKKWKQNGPIRDNGDGNSSLPIMVWTKISGDTYGFEKTNPTITIVPNNKTITECDVIINSQAVAFVTKTYPNT